MAASAGYDALELWLPKLWPDLERRGPEALVGMVKRRRLAAVALAPIRDVTFRDGAGREQVVAETRGAAQLARAFGASWVVVQPGERPDGADERDALGEGRDALDRLCRASERHDVGVALMPLGFEWASLRTLRQARAVIDAVGRRSIGLCLDTFHFHVGGSSLADLRSFAPRSIGLLRLADAPAGDREGLRDEHRLLPGKGTAPLGEILATLRVMGADPPAIVDARPPRDGDDAAGWARRLLESARALVKNPQLAGARPA